MQSTPMKCFIFFVGSLLILLGFSLLIATLIGMITAPDPWSWSSGDILIVIFLGVLPFVCGIALCVFATKKWLKKWWNSGKYKKKHLGAEVGEEKPVDPATAALNRRTNRIANVGAIVTVIIGIVVVLKLSNWFAGLIGISSAWILPIFILPIVVGAILGTKLYKKKFSKTVQRITDRIVQKMLK